MTSSEVPGGCGKETWSKWGLVHGCCRPDWTQSEVIKSGPNMLVGSMMTRIWGYPSSYGWDRRCLRDFLRVERSYISLIPQIKWFQEEKLNCHYYYYYYYYYIYLYIYYYFEMLFMHAKYRQALFLGTQAKSVFLEASWLRNVCSATSVLKNQTYHKMKHGHIRLHCNQLRMLIMLRISLLTLY